MSIRFRVQAIFRTNDPTSAFSRLEDVLCCGRFVQSSADLALKFTGLTARPRSVVAEWVATPLVDEGVGRAEVAAEVERGINEVMGLPAELHPGRPDLRVEFFRLRVTRATGH